MDGGAALSGNVFASQVIPAGNFATRFADLSGWSKYNSLDGGMFFGDGGLTFVKGTSGWGTIDLRRSEPLWPGGYVLMKIKYTGTLAGYLVSGFSMSNKPTANSATTQYTVAVNHSNQMDLYNTSSETGGGTANVLNICSSVFVSNEVWILAQLTSNQVQIRIGYATSDTVPPLLFKKCGDVTITYNPAMPMYVGINIGTDNVVSIKVPYFKVSGFTPWAAP